MRPNTRLHGLALAACLAFAATIAPSAPRAHDGHDHGASPPPISTTVAPRADASSEDIELVAIARSRVLEIHLDGFRDNAPVIGAQIEVDTPRGTGTAIGDGTGIYRLDAPWLAEASTIDLAVTVQADGRMDVLTATLALPLTEPEKNRPMSTSVSAVATAWAAGVDGSRLPWGADVWMVGVAGFLAGLTVATAFRRRRGAVAGLVLAIVVGYGDPTAAEPPSTSVARDMAQRFADGSLFVPKPSQRILALRTLFTEIETHPGTVELPARVIPDPSGFGFVQASVAGRLLPPAGGFPRLGTKVAAGDVLATVQPALGAADVTTQQQQAHELEQQISLMERRLERYRQITATMARAQIEDAEVELAGMRTRRANLDRSARQPENLVAPVSGVIAAVQATAGQIAETNAVIFQIIDPGRYWVEALSYEAHAFAGAATGRLPDGRGLILTFVGSGLSDRNQAIPVQFAVERDAKGLRAGQLLTVLAMTTDERKGIAVPRSSVLRGGNGQAIVYEHTNPERFVPREVRVEPLDGERVLIVSGVEAGRRVVTQGAELLNQIR